MKRISTGIALKEMNEISSRTYCVAFLF